MSCCVFLLILITTTFCVFSLYLSFCLCFFLWCDLNTEKERFLLRKRSKDGGQGWTWTSKSLTGNGFTARDAANYVLPTHIGSPCGSRTHDPRLKIWCLTAWPRGLVLVLRETWTLRTTVLSRICMPFHHRSILFGGKCKIRTCPDRATIYRATTTPTTHMAARTGLEPATSR